MVFFCSRAAYWAILRCFFLAKKQDVQISHQKMDAFSSWKILWAWSKMQFGTTMRGYMGGVSISTPCTYLPSWRAYRLIWLLNADFWCTVNHPMLVCEDHVHFGVLQKSLLLPAKSIQRSWPQLINNSWNTHIYIYIQYHQMSRHWVLVESVLKKRFHDFISSSVLTFEPMLKKRCYHFMSSKEQILPTRFPTRCRPMPSKAPQGAPAALSQHHLRFHSTTFGAFTAPLALSQHHF